METWHMHVSYMWAPWFLVVMVVLFGSLAVWFRFELSGCLAMVFGSLAVWLFGFGGWLFGYVFGCLAV